MWYSNVFASSPLIFSEVAWRLWYLIAVKGYTTNTYTYAWTQCVYKCARSLGRVGCMFGLLWREMGCKEYRREMLGNDVGRFGKTKQGQKTHLLENVQIEICCWARSSDMFETDISVLWRMELKRTHWKPILTIACYRKISEMLKIEFMMSSKTKSGETSTANLRMVNGVLLETPEPFQVQPRLLLDYSAP